MSQHPSDPSPTALKAREAVIHEYWSKLPIQAPPHELLEPALGYSGNARYVAFYYACSSARYDDGHVAAEPDTTTFLALVQHPLLAPHLCGAQLGTDDRELTHALILDRLSRSWYTARLRYALRTVATQFYPLDLIEPCFIETDPYGGALLALDPAQQRRVVEERIAVADQRRGRLFDWIDAQTGVAPTIMAEDINVGPGPIHRIYFKGTLVATRRISDEHIVLQLVGAYHVLEGHIIEALKQRLARDQLL